MNPDSTPTRSIRDTEPESTEPACARTIIGRRRLVVVVGAGTVSIAGCLDAGPTENDDEVPVYTVQHVDDGEPTEVEVAADQDLLAPVLDAGVDIPYRCEVGSCGDCTARYDGDATDVVVHEGNDYLSDEEIETGWVLTCVAFPRDDLALEVAHPDS